MSFKRKKCIQLNLNLSSRIFILVQNSWLSLCYAYEHAHLASYYLFAKTVVILETYFIERKGVRKTE